LLKSFTTQIQQKADGHVVSRKARLELALTAAIGSAPTVCLATFINITVANATRNKRKNTIKNRNERRDILLLCSKGCVHPFCSGYANSAE